MNLKERDFLFNLDLSKSQVGELMRLPVTNGQVQVRMVVRLADVLVHPSRLPRAALYRE